MGILDDKPPFDQVALLDLLAAGKIDMKQRLAAGDDRLWPDRIVVADHPAASFVEFIPHLIFAAERLPVDLSIQIAIEIGAARLAIAFCKHRFRLAARGVEGNDLTGRIAQTEIDPTGVVCGHKPLILRPVLRVHVAVVLEFPGLWG